MRETATLGAKAFIEGRTALAWTTLREARADILRRRRVLMLLQQHRNGPVHTLINPPTKNLIILFIIKGYTILETQHVNLRSDSSYVRYW